MARNRFQVGLASGSGFGIGFTGTLLLARAPRLLATHLPRKFPFPRIH